MLADSCMCIYVCVYTRAGVGACMRSSAGLFMFFSCLHSRASAEINIVSRETYTANKNMSDVHRPT